MYEMRSYFGTEWYVLIPSSFVKYKTMLFILCITIERGNVAILTEYR